MKMAVRMSIILGFILFLLAGCELFIPTENPIDCFVEDYGGASDIVDRDVTVLVEGNLYMCPQLECKVWDSVEIGGSVTVTARVWGIGASDGETCERIIFYVVEGYERDVYIPVDYTDASP